MSSKQTSSRLKRKGLLLSAFSFLFLTSCFLLLAFSFELSVSLCQVWAGSGVPRLTPAVQKAVYTAQQAMQDKDYDKAVQILKNFTKKHPKRSHYLTEFTLANALFLSGKDQEALSHYRSAVRLSPEFSYAWQNMGKVYFELKQYKTAGDCLLKGYEVSETRDYSVLYFAAVSYFLAKEYNKALPHLKYLVSGEAGPPKVEWLEAFLQVCMGLHMKDEAFRVVNLLLDKDGDNPRWWRFLAHLYLQQNDYKKAVAALTIRSYLTSINRKDIILLGDLNNAIGVPAKAAQYYEQVVILEDNTKPTDYGKLASAYLAAHRPTKARDALERALKKTKTSKLCFMLGQVLYEEEKWNEAYQVFSKAVRLDRKEGKAHLMMGYCALQMDKTVMARKAFQKATRFPKQRKTARGMLKQIALLSEYSKQRR